MRFFNVSRSGKRTFRRGREGSPRYQDRPEKTFAPRTPERGMEEEKGLPLFYALLRESRVGGSQVKRQKGTEEFNLF